ncbi:MAG: peptidase M56 BlaR1, partial [Clostridia bacterium]|nr:peptidase M56 BlaR1 [Clostridia bacterium]
MEGVFLKIIDMSFAASIVIAVISLARLILKKAPKKWSYSLWIAAAFRLCCPVSIGAAFSIFRIVPKSGISLVGGG